MTEYWPQIAYLACTFGGLLFAFTRHGNPRTGNHNAWIDLLATCFILFLLYFGGFFR
jgi:hypothetical protein